MNGECLGFIGAVLVIIALVGLVFLIVMAPLFRD